MFSIKIISIENMISCVNNVLETVLAQRVEFKNVVTGMVVTKMVGNFNHFCNKNQICNKTKMKILSFQEKFILIENIIYSVNNVL